MVSAAWALPVSWPSSAKAAATASAKAAPVASALPPVSPPVGEGARAGLWRIAPPAPKVPGELKVPALGADPVTLPHVGHALERGIAPEALRLGAHHALRNSVRQKDTLGDVLLLGLLLLNLQHHLEDHHERRKDDHDLRQGDRRSSLLRAGLGDGEDPLEAVGELIRKEALVHHRAHILRGHQNLAVLVVHVLLRIHGVLALEQLHQPHGDAGGANAQRFAVLGLSGLLDDLGELLHPDLQHGVLHAGLLLQGLLDRALDGLDALAHLLLGLRGTEDRHAHRRHRVLADPRHEVLPLRGGPAR